jgi:hypothetical protein
MGKWLVGIITAVITSVLIYWLTEGINANLRQKLTPEPAHSSAPTHRFDSKVDDDDDPPRRRTTRRPFIKDVDDDDDNDDPPSRRTFRNLREPREEWGEWCSTRVGRCQLFMSAPIGESCTCFNNFTSMNYSGVVVR